MGVSKLSKEALSITVRNTERTLLFGSFFLVSESACKCAEINEPEKPDCFTLSLSLISTMKIFHDNIIEVNHIEVVNF